MSYNSKMKKLKKDKIFVKECQDNILKIIKPGDVILEKGHYGLSDFYLAVPFYFIKLEAKRLYGKKAIVDDIHIVRFLSPDKILNVTPPVAKWSTIENICLEDITIYTSTEYQYTDKDIKIIIDGMEAEHEYIDDNGISYKMKLIGSKYGIGDLFDFLVNGLGGYENKRKISFFDTTKNTKVCSTGIGISEAYLRHYKEQFYKNELIPKRWFSEIICEQKFYDENPKRAKLIINDWNKNNKRLDNEMYRPSTFANSVYYRNEFKKILRMSLGKIIE